jgi:hypothetical protein
MRRIRFHWKLYAGYAVLIILTSVIGSIVILRGISGDARQVARSMLQKEAALLREMVAPILGLPAEAGLQQRLHLLGTALGALHSGAGGWHDCGGFCGRARAHG